MTEPDWAALDAAWRPARAAGVLGSATIEELRTHAAGYLPAACGVLREFRGIDLGTGAGVPGLLLALVRPRSAWVLIDASERRCELARHAVRAMALGDRVEVLHGRADDLAHDERHRARFDLVVARSFGPPPEVAEVGLPFVASGGRLTVSATSETGERWMGATSDLPISVDVRETEDGDRYVDVDLIHPLGDEWPRRPAKRRRAPVF